MNRTLTALWILTSVTFVQSSIASSNIFSNMKTSDAYLGKPDHDHDHGPGGGGEYPDLKGYYRLNCRYHNQEQHHGVRFCYASGVYRFDEETGLFSNVHLGVGCDQTTLYNDDGYITVETTLDRISPLNSAVPGVEIFPQGQLATEGTYTSMLDIPFGRMQGLCYVRYLVPNTLK